MQSSLRGVAGVIAALCCVLVAALPEAGAAAPESGPGAGPDGGVWSAAPVAGGGTSADRPYFYLEAGPGTVLEDTVAITNRGKRARTYELRGADAYNERGGGFAVREDGESRGTGAWIALAKERVTVPARTRAEVPFTVTVPPDAVPGDHPGAVVISAGKREAGVRVHLRVTGPALSALSVENVSVVGEQVRYSLVNRGNTALTPRLAIRADGVLGPLFQREARVLPVELLPGQRVTLREPWPDPPTLDRATVELTVTAQGGAKSTASAGYTAPWAAPAVLGVGAALVVGGLWWVRRRMRRSDRTGTGAAK
ncbi:WxL protein peptidoglycan domain-containing protein [Streptomyces gobiensis]|uniref:COG1470 family protein n=1 Tax=Streptomyces gobiensis TaxID=2875706 RepID=UPI001E326678|nr:DUF916 domain-containing protein [Streptomyces gobiensis]UGY91789.1 DUF916 domain-containing protein [Streptomyces gobiensis]